MTSRYRRIVAGLGIFVLALLVRLPFISYPQSVVFDEGLYASFSYFTARHIPYFDVHPPLARIMFSTLVGERPIVAHQLHDPGGAFNDFPYVPMRVFNVLLGSLLCVFVFVTSLFLFDNLVYAIVSASLVVFDNAFILYSRLILPDTLLLVLGLLGILFFVTQKEKVSGLSIGLAASVKWTGLGFAAIPGFGLLIQKRWKDLCFFVAGIAVTYILVQVLFFSLFPGGVVAHYMFQVEPFSSIHFPNGDHITDIVRSLPQYHRLMWGANFILHGHGSASSPLSWFVGGRQIVFWSSPESAARIVLTGNFLSWTFAFLGIFTIGFFALWSVVSGVSRVLPKREELLLLFGYCAHLLPLIFVGRDLFLYHYLPALVLAYIALPIAITHFVREFGFNEKYVSPLTWYVVGLSFVGFVILAPTTYGFTIPWLIH